MMEVFMNPITAAIDVGSSIQPKPAEFANATVQVIIQGVMSVMSRFGCTEEPALLKCCKNFGGGAMAFVALLDDLNQFRIVNNKNPKTNEIILSDSLIGEALGGQGGPLTEKVKEAKKDPLINITSDMIKMACIGTEIAFDIYELASAVAEFSDNPALKQACACVSTTVMAGKILGSLPLAFVSAKEVFDAKTSDEALKLTPRALETTSAAISNLILRMNGAKGSPLSGFCIAVLPNLCKVYRIVEEQTPFTKQVISIAKGVWTACEDTFLEDYSGIDMT